MNLRVVTADVDPIRDEAEISVIGSVLVEPACAGEALRLVGEADFSHREHVYLWQAIAWCADNSVTPDPLAVRDVLLRQHHLEAAGGADYLARIVETIPTSANLDYWARLVRERGARRRAAAALESGAELSEVREILERADAAQSESKVRVLDDVEIMALRPPEWLVDGVFPDGGLGLMYGPPGSGKGFAAIDLAFCIATGTPWSGREVQRGTVAYIAAEGAPGLSLRAPAWKVANDMAPEEPAGVYFIPGTRSLLDGAEVDRLIDALVQLPDPLRLIWIDTLNRTIAPGNESATEDMCAYIAACDRIREATGAFLGVIHHSGWNAERERGSSALFGAVDVKLKIQKSGKVITLICEKQRDAEEFEAIYLEMVQSLQSCALVGPKAGSDLMTAALAPNERAVLLGLAEKFFEEGASATEWMAAANVARSSFYDARKPLVDKGYVQKRGDGRGARYVVTESGRAALGPKVRGRSE